MNPDPPLIPSLIVWFAPGIVCALLVYGVLTRWPHRWRSVWALPLVVSAVVVLLAHQRPASAFSAAVTASVSATLGVAAGLRLSEPDGDG